MGTSALCYRSTLLTFQPDMSGYPCEVSPQTPSWGAGWRGPALTRFGTAKWEVDGEALEKASKGLGRDVTTLRQTMRRMGSQATRRRALLTCTWWPERWRFVRRLTNSPGQVGDQAQHACWMRSDPILISTERDTRLRWGYLGQCTWNHHFSQLLDYLGPQSSPFLPLYLTLTRDGTEVSQLKHTPMFIGAHTPRCPPHPITSPGNS